jgi:mRNA interferase MazF
MKPMQTSDRGFKRGDVVVVPFPVTDRQSERRRPALVVSSGKFNSRTGYLWLAMITSKTHKPLADDVEIAHAEVGLSKPSVVRLSKLATIEADRVVRVVGRLEKANFAAVKDGLAEILG